MKQQARLVYLSQVSGLNINRVRERSKYFLMYLINYSLSIGSLSSFMMTLLCPIATYFLFVFFLPFIKAYFIYLTLYHLFCSILLITRYFVLHFFFLTITSLYTKSHMSNVQPKTNLNHSFTITCQV